MRIETQEQAHDALLAHQRRETGIETQPDSAKTEKTAAGWAFFNVNGYLGTVTPDGRVVEEVQRVIEETRNTWVETDPPPTDESA